jgi:F0F1-type ATP synthase assembly protein I
MELISSIQVTSLISTVASKIATTAGTLWPIVAVSIGLPLSFWAIMKISEIFAQPRKLDKTSTKYLREQNEARMEEMGFEKN